MRLILNENDPIATNLVALSVEFEAKAAALSGPPAGARPTNASEGNS